MFTSPVGFFGVSRPIYWPNSVVDTPGVGTITNSSNVYDTDPTTYGVWADTLGYPYSVYSNVNAITSIDHKLYCLFSMVSSYSSMQLSISLDGGATYPIVGGSTPFDTATHQLEVSIPAGVVLSSLKVKILFGPDFFNFGRTGSMNVYSLYFR